MEEKNEATSESSDSRPKEAEFSIEESEKLLQFQKKIGYTFQDPSLLQYALTHKSFPLRPRNEIESGNIDNERLEFLGDAVLSFVAAHILYVQAPTKKEGELSRLRSSFVCQEHLAKMAQELSLGSYIRAEKAMRMSGGVKSASVLSDTLEAVIGAVFLDGGLEPARRVIEQLLGPMPSHSNPPVKDPKSVLQELLQATCSVTPVYRIVEISGPLHAPKFQVEVSANGIILASGEGNNKRAATEISAKNALSHLSELSAEQIKEKITTCLQPKT